MGFNPLSLSPVLWLDFSDPSKLYTDSSATTLVSADGDPIGAIKDKSSNAYTINQTDGTAKPLYKTNIKNGRSVGRFDGVNDYLTHASSTALYKNFHSAQATILAAWRAGSGTNTDAFYGLLGNNASTSAIGFCFAAENRTAASALGKHRGRFIAGRNGSPLVCDTNLAAFDNSAPENTYFVLGLQLDLANGTAASRISISKNNSTTYTGNTSSGTVNTGSATNSIGFGAVIDTGAPFGFLAGDICEIIMVPNALGATDFSNAMNYLVGRWT